MSASKEQGATLKSLRLHEAKLERCEPPNMGGVQKMNIRPFPQLAYIPQK